MSPPERFDAAMAAAAGDTALVVTVYENERWYPLKRWCSTLLPTDRPHWSDEAGNAEMTKESVPLPPRYTWVTEWGVDVKPDEGADKEGWEFALNFRKVTFDPAWFLGSLVRRRPWRRLAVRRRAADGPDDAGDYFVDIPEPGTREAYSEDARAPEAQPRDPGPPMDQPLVQQTAPAAQPGPAAAEAPGAFMVDPSPPVGDGMPRQLSTERKVDSLLAKFADD